MKSTTKKLLTFVCATLALCLAQAPAAFAEKAQDSCVACHSDEDFLVKNKKLYRYFNEWKLSVHKQEGVSCTDCHGGNPKASDAKGAHAQMEALSFDRVPATCGKCHTDTLEGYQQSPHFKQLQKAGGMQGPNCVTCHSSISSVALNVSTVSQVCNQCHNEGTGFHAEIPRRAQNLLNHRYSINSFYRYISTKGEPAKTQAFLKEIDADLARLAVTWHTFDLNKVEEDTKAILARLQQKREEISKK